MHVLVIGNIVDGVVIVGPFVASDEQESGEVANDYADIHFRGDDWICVTVVGPEFEV